VLKNVKERKRSWAALKRKEENREVGHAESRRARKRNMLLGFRPDKVVL
jgi:hypothetical protein